MRYVALPVTCNGGVGAERGSRGAAQGMDVLGGALAPESVRTEGRSTVDDAMLVGVTGVVSYAVAAQGAFFSRPFLTAAVAAAALGVLAAAARRRVSPLAPAVAPVVAVIGLSTLIADTAPSAALAACLLLAALVGLATVVHGMSPEHRATLTLALGWIATAVAITAWLGVVLRIHVWANVGMGLWRGAGVITYANATAFIAVVGVLVATSRLGAGTRPWPAPAMLVLAGAGLAATVSRGGLVAVLCGLAVIWLTGPHRKMVERSLWPMAGVLVAAAALIPSLDQTLPPRPVVAALGLAVGLWVGQFGPARTRPRLLAVVGLLLATAAGGAVTAVGSPVVAGRIVPASESRLSAWAAGVDAWLEAPVLGVGLGNHVAVWERADGTSEMASYLHNEYLQMLVELGVIGAMGLLVAVWMVARRLPWGRHDGGAVLSCAVAVAFGVHSGLEVLWHVPAIPLLASTVLAAGLKPPATSEPEGPTTSLRPEVFEPQQSARGGAKQ